jgi:hypothetical protein
MKIIEKDGTTHIYIEKPMDLARIVDIMAGTPCECEKQEYEEIYNESVMPDSSYHWDEATQRYVDKPFAEAFVDGICMECKHMESCDQSANATCADFEEEPKEIDWAKVFNMPLPPDWTPPVGNTVTCIEKCDTCKHEKFECNYIYEADVIELPWHSYDEVFPDAQPDIQALKTGLPGPGKTDITSMNAHMIAHDVVPMAKLIDMDYAELEQRYLASLHTTRTTEDFWDCECDHNYIKPSSQLRCIHCGSWAEDQPDSRCEEVIKMLTDQAIDLLTQVRKYKD